MNAYGFNSGNVDLSSVWLTLGLIGPAEWTDDALCAQTDPESFFPEMGGSTAAAKRVCVACPVRTECLEDAMARNERFGVWGGLSERERRRLAAQRAAEGTGAAPGRQGAGAA